MPSFTDEKVEIWLGGGIAMIWNSIHFAALYLISMN